MFSKRAEAIEVVLGEGVHNVKCTLTPTRNGLAYAGKIMGREIVYERSREQVQADIDRLEPRSEEVAMTGKINGVMLTRLLRRVSLLASSPASPRRSRCTAGSTRTAARTSPTRAAAGREGRAQDQARGQHRRAGTPGKPGAQLPFVLARAMKEYPVTLYTSPNCTEPCNAARELLNKRGVPFSEVQVWEEESNAELKRVSGNNQVPALKVGSTVQSGYEPSSYGALLDTAGYPARGRAARRDPGRARQARRLCGARRARPAEGRAGEARAAGGVGTLRAGRPAAARTAEIDARDRRGHRGDPGRGVAPVVPGARDVPVGQAARPTHVRHDAGARPRRPSRWP